MNSERKNGPYRSRDSKWLGVCAGMAEYFGISPFWVRIAAVVCFFVFTGWPVLILYVVAAALMKPSPVRSFENSSEKDFYEAYTHAPKYTVRHIHEKYVNLNRRIQRMEDRVTARAYEWDRKMNEHS
ncbi:MAG: PspC domain-containing protein, partial [Spirochaetales bacterium]|jgi:phage shock protein C|nr:PspC domain-containing protein [Spirochaetales bacterium]